MRHSFIAVAIASFLFLGCSEDSGPETSAVTATVTRSGQPAQNVSVTLVPVEPSNPTASGMTDETGKAILVATANAEGAVPGKYKVVLSAVTSAEAYSGNRPPENPIPSEWQSASTSPKEVEITESGPNEFKIEF